MAITTSWDIALLDSTMSGVTMEAATKPSPADVLIKEESAKGPLPDRIKTHEVGTLGPMAQSFEDGPFYEDKPPKGYTKETVYRKFTIKLTFTEEALEDDLYGITDKYAQQTGYSYHLTKNLQVAQLYDNLFNTTYFTAPDGVAIASTAHTSTVLGVGNRANCLTQSSALCFQAVQDLMTVAKRQKDMRGYPDPQLIDGQINVLIQPEDEWMYTTVFEGGQYDPTDNKFAPNRIKESGRTFTKAENLYCTGTGAQGAHIWGLFTDEFKPIMYKKWPLKTSNYLIDGNKNMVFDARARHWYHVGTWRGGYFSGN